MKNNDFTTTILVDATPAQVFDAVNNVRGWWSENIEGDTKKLNSEFLYHYQDVHRCKMKITIIAGLLTEWNVYVEPRHANYFFISETKLRLLFGF